MFKTKLEDEVKSKLKLQTEIAKRFHVSNIFTTLIKMYKIL